MRKLCIAVNGTQRKGKVAKHKYRRYAFRGEKEYQLKQL